MYTVNTNRESVWHDFRPGVRIKFRLAVPALILAARNEAAEAVNASKDKKSSLVIASGDALTRALARLGIEDWEGVGDENGKPLPVTPNNVDFFMDGWLAWNFVERVYVIPALLRDDEKNAFSPSRNGTSGAITTEKTTARTAKRNVRRARTR